MISGHYEGFALQRRMTFVTTNDNGGLNWRQTHWVNSHAMSAVQLKADTGPGSGDNASFVLRSVMMGAWMTSTDLGGIGPNPCGPTGEKPCVLHSETFKLHLRLYREKQRPILRGGDVYHIFPQPDGIQPEGMQFFNRELNKGSVIVLKPSANVPSGADEVVVALKGLQRDANYTLSFQDRTGLNDVASGAYLMDVGLNVSGMVGNEASEIVWLN